MDDAAPTLLPRVTAASTALPEPRSSPPPPQAPRPSVVAPPWGYVELAALVATTWRDASLSQHLTSLLRACRGATTAATLPAVLAMLNYDTRMAGAEPRGDGISRQWLHDGNLLWMCCLSSQGEGYFLTTATLQKRRITGDQWLAVAAGRQALSSSPTDAPKPDTDWPVDLPPAPAAPDWPLSL